MALENFEHQLLLFLCLVVSCCWCRVLWWCNFSVELCSGMELIENVSEISKSVSCKVVIVEFMMSWWDSTLRWYLVIFPVKLMLWGAVLRNFYGIFMAFYLCIRYSSCARIRFSPLFYHSLLGRSFKYFWIDCKLWTWKMGGEWRLWAGAFVILGFSWGFSLLSSREDSLKFGQFILELVSHLSYVVSNLIWVWASVKQQILFHILKPSGVGVWFQELCTFYEIDLISRETTYLFCEISVIFF